MATLQVGSKGPAVKKLQEQLNEALGKKLVKPDGKFGPDTQKALELFQKKNRLKVNGIADKKVLDALESSGAGSKKEAETVAGVKLTVNGKTEEMKAADYEAGKKVILKNLKRGLLVAIQNRASECRVLYDHFVDINKDQKVVSWLVEATSGAKLPSESVISSAEAAAAKVESAIASGDMAKIKAALEACEKPLNAAVNAMRDYQKKVIGGSENWVTGLEVTRDVSFTVVSTWATGGAGSVAGAAYAAGAVALLKESAGAVGKVTANPSKAPTLNDARNMALEVGVAALGGAFAKGEFGKKVISGAGGVITKRIGAMGLPRLAGVGSKTLAGWIPKVMEGVGSSVVEEAVKQAVKQLKSDAKPEQLFEGIATKAMAAALLGPFEEALKSSSLGPKIAAVATKKFGDGFFTVANQGIRVELVPRKQKELVLKFLAGPAGDVVEKFLLEPVAKKASGSESPEQFADKVAGEFVNNSAATKQFEEFLAQHAKSNPKDFQPVDGKR